VSMRILIVDPDWFFLAQARDHLESRGNHVIHEPDPLRALECCRRWRPDVAMLSAEMSECCDGNLLTEFKRLHPAPAVVLTAALERFDKAWRAWQRGGDDMLFKPLLHPSELHVSIVTALENAICPRRRQTAGHARALSA
jgi:DNA-binding response OmpR family regulator